MNAMQFRVMLACGLAIGVNAATFAQSPAPAGTPTAAAPARSAMAPGKLSLPYQSKDGSVGVVNCANSLCHGSVQPFKDSPILQTEYVTWSRVDKHARAYRILGNEQSQRIARNLGIGDPQKAKVCLDCHAHNVPADLRGERFKFEDGVSCEACHGPAGRWLASHVETGATHASNIDNGLFDTGDPVARAQLCLSCHFGNADRFVTHRIMGAGHPRMSFELDTFTVVEPAHFKADEDWQKRKQTWDGVKVWAIGQALAVKESMSVLADPRRSRDGLFPELVLFDCHACHHPMSEKRWAPRVPGLGPGVVRLNDSSMLMARQIARAIDAPFGARVGDSMNRLQQSVVSGGDALANARQVSAEMDDLIARLANVEFGPAEMRRVLGGLIDEGLNGQYRDYAGAEQATMAIGSVANFMYQKGVLKSARDVNGGLAQLQAAVADDERYKPGQFEAALRSFRGSVGL
ncbi:MAG TPA: multiheme c-type cytochrome [Casimicrobiaceae bacterium]|nr:multiheme c-type cytochrome [Casimicrobiaceae bacterium]